MEFELILALRAVFSELYGQWFLTYGPSFKIAIFGHEKCIAGVL